MSACNERFGASGGVARPTVCVDFGSLSPVRATVTPPPAAKLAATQDSAVRHRSRKLNVERKYKGYEYNRLLSTN